MDQSVIQTNNLSKRYGGSDTLAVNKLDLSVKAGEVYGFLGPNGAGKSTTIKMLLNFIQPTAGQATILGRDAVSESTQIKKSVGYLAGEIALYPKMDSRQFLDYMSRLQPAKSGVRADLVKRFQFGPSLNKKVRDLSKGNRQKLGIIQAFMHEPQVLILDEPTSGLDPLMQEEFFKLLHQTKQRGGSVFISSHNLAEVQRMCDRVGFIREGKLINQQTIADISADAARTFDISFANPAPLAELRKVPKAKVTPINDKAVAVYMRGDLSPMFKVLAKYKVLSLSQREVNLEEEFMHFYKTKDEK